MKEISTYMDQIIRLTIEYVPKIMLAIVVFSIGWWLINRITRIAMKGLDSSRLSADIRSFSYSVINIGLKVLLIISIADIVGIATTSFVGIIAAMGFAIGLALQGNLSNFASGVLILIMRPFKVGDEVKLQGIWAFVKEIQIFHTVFANFDNTETIIPNSVVMNGTIQNMSQTSTRGISIKLAIPFEEDLDKVMYIVKEAAYKIPEVDKSKEPFFWITNHEPHNMQMYVGFKIPQEGFWTTDFKVRKSIIDACVKHKLKVVYPEGVGYGAFGTWKSERSADDNQRLVQGT